MGKIASPNLDKLAGELREKIKGDVLVDLFNRVAFSTDSSIYQIIPQCVAAVRDAEDVAAVVKYACDKKIPIVARGAGSGLAGEALGSGIVLDFTRYMNRILGVEQGGECVICEPGVVLDELNQYLSGFGRKIGPDPSSGNRAVIGGVVANNATGAHSLQYGYIAEHVERIDAVLYDGTAVTLTNDMDPRTIEDPHVRELALGCMSVLEGKENIIAAAQPKTRRNRCGYGLPGLVHDGRIDLARLMAGSEGTLAVFTKLTLRTVELPACKALLQMEFENFEDMARAVPVIVESGAAACELMDRKLMDMAIDSLPKYRGLFPETCAASLVIEHIGPTIDEVGQKLDRTLELTGALMSGCRKIFDPAEQQRIWKSRKDAVPLLNRERGPAHAIPFIEDVSVENRQLDQYIVGLEAIGKKYDIPMAFYGHAGDGELHIRPYLDLSRPDEVEKMRRIADEVFELAWSLGGTISGEHADGLLRAGFIERQYGRDYYELLRGIKDVFDPHGQMNPGKIINDDRDIMIKNLRSGYVVQPDRLGTELLFEPGEFRYEIEQCNGDGVCLCKQSGTRMCPVFRAAGEELASSRGKANMLRAWITGILEKKDFESEEFRKIIGLCINCKMCSVECPSGVDISKLVMEARAQLAGRMGLTRTQMALSHNRLLAMLCSAFSPLSNFVLNLGPVGWIIEKTIGLDRRRGMPAFARGSFIRQARGYLREQGPIARPVDRVAYFVDTYANYNDHELGWAVIKLLRANRIEVIIPEQRPAPLPAMMYGDLKTARADLEYSVRSLGRAVEDGYKIICSEPSAALCLKEELRLFVDTPAARLVSQNTFELMAYLYRLWLEQKLTLPAAKDAAAETTLYAYHAPCHLIALGERGAGVELLNQLKGVAIKDTNGGCCGLAGTTGMDRDKYDLSVEIGREMKEKIMAMDTPWAMTECGACKMQIEHLTGKKVIHPVKVLARAYGVI